MSTITRSDGNEKTYIGRNDDQRELERSIKSASFNKGGNPVSPQDLIAIHNQRDKIDSGNSVSSIADRYANNQQSDIQAEVAPEVNYGVDKVSALIEKAKEKLNKISNVDGLNAVAAQDKLRYPKDEDTGRKHDEQASKDKYYPDYESGRDYLKKLKSNFMLKLRKISSLFNSLSQIDMEIEKTAKADKEKDKEKEKKEDKKALEKEKKEKEEKKKEKKEKKADLEGSLKVVGAKIRRAISKISSVEEDLRSKKISYPKEKDLGRDYDQKDAKDRYKGPESNPLNKDLSKMWSLNKTVKTARDETMKIDIPDEKTMGGNNMDKLPLDKKEDVKSEAPKGKIPEEDEKKMINELKSVIESLNKADEDFTMEIKKIEKAIEHMEEEAGVKKPFKKKEEDKGLEKGENGEIEKTPKPKPDLKDLGEEDVKKELPFGKKSSLNKKAEVGELEEEEPLNDMSPETGNDWLDKYIKEQIVKSDKEITVDMVKEQIQNVMGDLTNIPIMETINKVNEIIGTSPGVEEDGYFEEAEDVIPSKLPEEGTGVESITAIFTRKPTKQASYWEVKDKDNKTILKASCSQIYGKKTFENWNWISSEDYGKELCARIREEGPTVVANLLKTDINMTKHARDIEIQAANKKKKSSPKKNTNNTDYYSKAYGDKGYASKLTKKYKSASLEEKDNKIIESFQKENAELKEKLSQLEDENERIAKKVSDKEKEIEKEKKEKEEAKKKASLEELDKKLRIRANKAIALANIMIGKGLIKENQKDELIDDFMLMDDISFSIEEKLANDKISMIEAVAENKQGNKLIRKGGLNNGINIISNNIGSFKSKLEDLWKKPGANLATKN
ncbi:MAG: hypothetical protein ACFFG0_05240 [Candidatus Thorarchaeota archaeon]